MKPQAWKKKGAILVYVVLIMALLIVFGVGMIFLAKHNSNTTVNEVYAEQAYLTARSGLRSTMTMMEEDTAKTSDVASKLKTAKTLTSSVDLTANKLGTVSVQVSCTDTDCTILQIDSTGTYQGVSQTVTGYMKNSAPGVVGPLTVLDEVTDGDSNHNVTVTDFNGDTINTKEEVRKLGLGLGDSAFQQIDPTSLGTGYILVNCANKAVEIEQYQNNVYINDKQYALTNNNSIFVLYNTSAQSNSISLYAESNSNYSYVIAVADLNRVINLVPYSKMNYSMNAWIVAPGCQVNISKYKSYEFNLVGGIICKTFSWSNGAKGNINGEGQQDILKNSAFTSLYNKLAGGGWTRSYEKP